MQVCWGLLFVFWCEGGQVSPPPTDNFCRIYKPVTWSASDTRLTKEQVDTNNRIWKKLCTKAPK